MILARQPLETTEQHCIGAYGGSTAIPVGPSWFLTVDHVAEGQVIQIFHPERRDLKVLRRVDVGSNLHMVQVEGVVPRWYPIRRTLLDAAPVECLMLGFGRTNMHTLEGGGYGMNPDPGAWEFPMLPLVGTNMVLGLGGNWMCSYYDDNNVPTEASFALNDSGGVWLAGGEICGVAYSVSGRAWGRTSFGDQSLGFQPAGVIDRIDAVMADADGSGVVDNADLYFFISRWTSSFSRTTQQFFSFLSSWFNGRRKI